MTRTARPSMIVATLLCSLALAACGGGDEAGVEGADSETVAGLDARESPQSSTAAAVEASAQPRKTTQASHIDPAGDPLRASAAVAAGVSMTQLGVASSQPDAGLRGLARTARCAQGFVPPGDLTRKSAAPKPAAGGGVFFNPTELATWRVRARAGPFVADADHAAGSPGDWGRIKALAGQFLAQGEPLPLSALDDSSRARHGQLARDAAFVHLLVPDAKLLAAVRRWLLEQAALAANDFAGQLCFQYPDGLARDGYFAEAPWLARYIATYDFVRSGLPAAERVTIENYIRRNAWFFATQLDWGLAALFPQRLAGDYRERGASAASSGEDIWWTRRVDGNHDCRVDENDDAVAYPTYTHARADGSLGAKVSVLAMWFNNRRAANALAAGAAGVLLADAELQHRAKRYTMEWLTYGAYADGSVAEYTRHGEYCVNRQGLVYGAMNVQSGVMLGRILARQGDRSLATFSTREGLFGSQSGAGDEPKSLALVAQTLLHASTGELAWYRAEPAKRVQEPRAATALGMPRERYLNGAQAMDLMHELSLLSSAAVVARVPVAATLLKHPLILRRADAGVPVVSGVGAWTDAWGVLPAAYLLRP